MLVFTTSPSTNFDCTKCSPRLLPPLKRARNCWVFGSTLWSADGTAWHLEYVEAASSFWTSAPNQWGLFIQTNSNTTPNLVTRCDFIDWDE